MVRAARAIITLSIVCYWCALAGGQIIGYGDNVNGIEGDGFVVWPLIVAGDPNISPADATDGSCRYVPMYWISYLAYSCLVRRALF